MKRKGSLTVEATLVSVVFISIMLLLLSMVKLVIVEYTLSYCAHESAKSIAEVGYLTSIVNNIQEDLDDTYDATGKEQAKSLGDFVASKGSSISQSFFSYGISKETKKDKAKLTTGLTKAGVSTAVSIAKNIGANFYGFFRDEVNSFKTNLKYDFVCDTISATIDEKGIPINKDKIKIELVKFPETNREYTVNSLGANYVKNGLVPGKDFDKDDAVVIVSYDVEINLPFINKLEFTIRKMAVEKCWINGSNGIITKFEGEGVAEKALSEIITAAIDHATRNNVYVVNGSSKYHRSKYCHKCSDKHVTEIKEYVAKDNGYSACSSCN